MGTFCTTTSFTATTTALTPPAATLGARTSTSCARQHLSAARNTCRARALATRSSSSITPPRVCLGSTQHGDLKRRPGRLVSRLFLQCCVLAQDPDLQDAASLSGLHSSPGHARDTTVQ